MSLSANEIIPGIWLGNESASADLNFLKTLNINCIVNATDRIPCKFYKQGINYYQIPVGDPGPTSDLDQPDNALMLKHIPQVLLYIDNNRKKNKNILIHCHAGIQRSATVVLLYLIKHFFNDDNIKDRYQKALTIMIKNRPIVFYNGQSMSFKPVIIAYLNELM